MPPRRTPRKYVMLPVQIIALSDGALVKRGGMEFRVNGTGVANALSLISSITQKRGVSLQELLDLFVPSSWIYVRELITKLKNRRLLVPLRRTSSLSVPGENHLNVFLWHFGKTSDQVLARLNKVHIDIIGVNFISRQLALTLSSCDQGSFNVIDHPEHRNGHFFNETGKLIEHEWPDRLKRPLEWKDEAQLNTNRCMVVTSDFGGQTTLRQWNRLCIENKTPFLPLLLKNMIGYVGPFIVPGETACYECFSSRQISHMIDGAGNMSLDHDAFKNQRVCGFHPSMATILGDLAAFEIMRFYCNAIPGTKPGRLLEIDLLNSTMTERTVLKVPRCPVCSPLYYRSPNILTKQTLLKNTPYIKSMVMRDQSSKSS